MKLKPREQAVLSEINRHYALYGIPPSVRYIMRRTQIPSSDTVQYYYHRLVAAGKITLTGSPGSHRKPIPTPLLNLIKETLSHEHTTQFK